MKRVTIKFRVRNKQYEYNIEHNLNRHSLDIEAALHNWLARTKDYSCKSFCQYVVSKDPENLICKRY